MQLGLNVHTGVENKDNDLLELFHVLTNIFVSLVRGEAGEEVCLQYFATIASFLVLPQVFVAAREKDMVLLTEAVRSHAQRCADRSSDDILNPVRDPGKNTFGTVSFCFMASHLFL